MLTKSMLESTTREVNKLGKICVVPYEFSTETGLCQTLRPRWRFRLWCIATFILFPLQVIYIYLNVIAEALKIEQGSSDITYLIFFSFCAVISSFGLLLSLYLAIRIAFIQQGINQALLLNRYLARKLIYFLTTR